MKSETSQLTLLGHKTVYKQDYAPEVLETFINKHPENDYWVRFNCPEFTSLCRLPDNPISLPYKSTIFPENIW